MNGRPCVIHTVDIFMLGRNGKGKLRLLAPLTDSILIHITHYCMREKVCGQTKESLVFYKRSLSLIPWLSKETRILCSSKLVEIPSQFLSRALMFANVYVGHDLYFPNTLLKKW